MNKIIKSKRQRVILEEIVKYIEDTNNKEILYTEVVIPKDKIHPALILDIPYDYYKLNIEQIGYVVNGIIQRDITYTQMFQSIKFILNYIVVEVNKRMSLFNEVYEMKVTETTYSRMVRGSVKSYFDTLKGITIQNEEKERIIAYEGGFKKRVVN